MIVSKLDLSLSGYRIGISGAVPDRSEWTDPAEDRGILEFVALLSGLVFKYGGHIVHGSHPTFTPVILRQAELHASPQNNRYPVTLVMSQLWEPLLSRVDRERYERETTFFMIPKVGEGGIENPETRNKSLTAMRLFLAQQMNTLIAVGGKQHAADRLVPGVAEELGLAQMRGMACFLVGGLGGMANVIAQHRAESEMQLRNELPQPLNFALLTSKDVAASVGIIFDHLASNPDLYSRVLSDLQ